MEDFSQFAIKVPNILLPKNMDLKTWSVIACDQYTQDAAYWQSASELVGSKPSMLSCILPEIYLGSDDCEKRIQNIKQTMAEYLAGGVFSEQKESFVYVERTTEYKRTRRGLVVAIDLECYEWKPFSTALIRATEATIPERIPPRKKIRSGSALESPHIMLLVNDKDDVLIGAAKKSCVAENLLYDGSLMLNGGHIKGYRVGGEGLFCVKEALKKLYTSSKQDDGSVFLFAVGDGNHSLATAKAVWEEFRDKSLASGAKKEDVMQSPVRYALVEIVNIYDKGLTFEPIHRVLFAKNTEAALCAVKASLGGTLCAFSSFLELESAVKASPSAVGFVHTPNGGATEFLCLETPIKELLVSRLQPALDEFIAREQCGIDYIHGSDEVLRLGSKEGSLTILLPPVAKDSFFLTISKTGPLPRKSFSMGEASEKRFYLECRALFPANDVKNGCAKV